MTRTEWGDALRYWRLARGLTQGELASRVGVTEQSVRAWEHGRATPRRRVRERLRLALPEVPAAPVEGARNRRSETLSERDYRILKMEADGLSADAIARTIGVSRRIVAYAARRAEAVGFQRAEAAPEEIDDERRAFGRRLREARRKRGWTQAELAQWLSVEPPALRDWELGRRSPAARGAKALEQDLPEVLPLPRRRVKRSRRVRRRWSG